MDRCPECDSEISPNATFCSFCGTSVQPADVKSSEADEHYNDVAGGDGNGSGRELGY